MIIFGGQKMNLSDLKFQKSEFQFFRADSMISHPFLDRSGTTLLESENFKSKVEKMSDLWIFEKRVAF